MFIVQYSKTNQISEDKKMSVIQGNFIVLVQKTF